MTDSLTLIRKLRCDDRNKIVRIDEKKLLKFLVSENNLKEVKLFPGLSKRFCNVVYPTSI